MGVAVAGYRTCLAADNQWGEYEFVEIVMISVNCTTAQVSVDSGVISANETLVHFPSGIDMNAEILTNATQIMLSVSTSNSILHFVFNNTEANNAEKYANTTVELCFEQHFHLGFKHNSTVPFNSFVNVTFTGNGVGNMTEFTEQLIGDCLAPDLGGFSSTFLSIAREINAYTHLVAQKASGSFEWTYAMGVSYSTTFPDGAGEHTVDVLDLLNVELLAPSEYAFIIAVPNSFYTSIVILDVVSNTTVTFVSCAPNQASAPRIRGWYINLYVPSPAKIQGTFSFGGDNTPVTELSLTFSGVIIPEFTVPAYTVLMLTSVVAVAIKKRF
ncbi:MAG: hypothetical protein QXT10_02905 [Candidatus Bathyarchaeia archaeon]